MTPIALPPTPEEDNGLRETNIPCSKKIQLSSDCFDLISDNCSGCVAKTSISSSQSVSSSIDMSITNRKHFARVNNGFIAEIPKSILKRRSHITFPYGDLLRVVLSSAVTYITDLQDIMRAEIALRFPLSPFDSRPAYVRYVRCGKLMVKELETRTCARSLPSVSRRAWKHALALTSATKESPEFPINFHPRRLGLDYDEYDGEHPRDFLARSLMVLANHPKTRGILRRIAQVFAADHYNSNPPQNALPQGTGYSSDGDTTDVVDAGIDFTREKNPRPYEVKKRKQVVCDLRQIIQNLAGKLQECADGVGCVQLGSAATSKIVDHPFITNMDNLWNVTMQVTALQSDTGPVNYTTSYLSTNPSAMEKSPNWESSVAEMDDSIFGPNLAASSSPQFGWGFMPHLKNREYHLVNSEPDNTNHPSDTGIPENHVVLLDTPLGVVPKEQKGSMDGGETGTERNASNIGSCDGHLALQKQSVCQEMSSEQEKKAPSTVTADKQPTVQCPTTPSINKPNCSSKVPPITSKVIQKQKLRKLSNRLFEGQPACEDGKNPTEAASQNWNDASQNFEKLDVVMPSDEAVLRTSHRRVLPEKVLPFNNAKHCAMFQFLLGKSTSKSLLTKGIDVTATKSPEVKATEVHNQNIRDRRLAPNCRDSSSKISANMLRRRKSSVWKVTDKSRSVPLGTNKPPDVQSREPKPKRCEPSYLIAQHCWNAGMSYPAMLGNWLVNQIVMPPKEEEEQVATHTPTLVKRKVKHSKSSSIKSDVHMPAERLPTVCVPETPILSASPGTSSSPTNGEKKRARNRKKNAERKAKRRATSRPETDDHQIPQSNQTHACSNVNAEIPSQGLSPSGRVLKSSKMLESACKEPIDQTSELSTSNLNRKGTEFAKPRKQLSNGSKETRLRKSERPFQNVSRQSEITRYHPFERRQGGRLSLKPDTLGSPPAPVPNPMKEKHSYFPNPLVVAQWQDVIKHVTGNPC